MVKSPKDVRSFLGLAGVYRCFTPYFTLHAFPLFKLLNLDQKTFNEVMQNKCKYNEVTRAMKKLKDIIIEHPVLLLPEKNNLEFIVRTDTSGFAEGATLCQV